MWVILGRIAPTGTVRRHGLTDLRIKATGWMANMRAWARLYTRVKVLMWESLRARSGKAQESFAGKMAQSMKVNTRTENSMVKVQSPDQMALSLAASLSKENVRESATT